MNAHVVDFNLDFIWLFILINCVGYIIFATISRKLRGKRGG